MLNVMNTYLKFNRKRLINYSKIILEKNYNKTIFEGLIDTYFNLRYTELPSGLCAKVINKDLVKKAEILSKDNDVDDIKLILSYFPFIYYLDGFLKKDIDVIVDKVNDFRFKQLNLEPIDDELKSTWISDKKRIDKYLDSFDSKEFYLSTGKTRVKNLYKTEVMQLVKIPKLYSDYAIDKVYNRGIVLENKLFINYTMVSVLVLKDAINLDCNYYIVEFSKSLIEKEDKLKRLFNIIDNDIVKDRVILSVTENDFLEFRDNYLKYINEGYKFILYLSDDSSLKNDSIRKVFSYVVDNDVVEVG